jgi:hypothetical protein
MEKLISEALPLPEQNAMCPMIAVAVLNRKGYQIPIPQANCRMAIFFMNLEMAVGHQGRQLLLFQDFEVTNAKLRLVKKNNDGVLLLRSKSNPNKFHFIAFIVTGGKLQFYEPDAGKLDVYRLKNNASATDFDDDFSKFFPDYKIVQVYIIEPSQMQGGGSGSIKKAALKNLKDRGITGVMLEAAFHQLKTRAGVKVVSKMFGFKSWGYLRSDHVLEIKNKEGTMFRYKIARGKTHPVIMAKIPGGPYEEIMTVRVPDYGTDDYDSWSIAKHQARHVTRKLKLKPRYRTRKN